MINDLWQPAIAGPLVEVNKVGCDADGPFLIQRQHDKLSLEFAIISNDIYCTGATRAPVPIDDQVQVTRVAIHLGVVHRRPTGTVEVYWFLQFDTQALWGLAKTNGKAHLVRRRTDQFRV